MKSLLIIFAMLTTSVMSQAYDRDYDGRNDRGIEGNFEGRLENRNDRGSDNRNDRGFDGRGGRGFDGRNDRGFDGNLDQRGRPTESFRQTCQVLREDYRRIQANCKTWKGNMIYNDFDRRGCTTDIANMDGRLVCAGSEGNNPGHPGNPGYPGYPGNPGHPGNPGNPGYPGYPTPLPSGSYQRSCQQCRADNFTLSCQCLDTRGQYHFTSIDYRRCGSEITNMNGQLVCQ